MSWGLFGSDDEPLTSEQLAGRAYSLEELRTVTEARLLGRTFAEACWRAYWEWQEAKREGKPRLVECRRTSERIDYREVFGVPGRWSSGSVEILGSLP